MYSVMIVDDDFINRTALKNMIDWESIGFKVVGEAKNGQIAMERLREQEVQVIITDMKMPVMDGLELIQALRGKDILMVVLSAFDDYDLVREAFKLGVEDYLLKSKLSPAYLTEFLEKISKKLKGRMTFYEVKEEANLLRDYLKGTINLGQCDETYALVLVDIPNFSISRSRFPNIKTDIVLPLMDLIRQLPGAARHCEYAEQSEATILLRYHDKQLEWRQVERFCEQISRLAKNYMNLEVTLSFSPLYDDVTQIGEGIKEVYDLLSLRYIYGEGQLYHSQRNDILSLEEIKGKKEQYKQLIEALRLLDNERMYAEQERCFSAVLGTDEVSLKKECLCIIYYEAEYLHKNGDSLWNLFGKSIVFDKRMDQLLSEKDYLTWLYNFNRYLMDYLVDSGGQMVRGSMETIRHYIMDNYADENLKLAQLSQVVGMNESYLSTKFKKEFGTSVSEYIRQVRINKAKELMRTTTLKVYEISEAVGYRNVEHFTRVFHSVTGSSPKKYMTKKENS